MDRFTKGFVLAALVYFLLHYVDENKILDELNMAAGPAHEYT